MVNIIEKLCLEILSLCKQKMWRIFDPLTRANYWLRIMTSRNVSCSKNVFPKDLFVIIIGYNWLIKEKQVMWLYCGGWSSAENLEVRLLVCVIADYGGFGYLCIKGTSCFLLLFVQPRSWKAWRLPFMKIYMPYNLRERLKL